jgi:hypothetical protein
VTVGVSALPRLAPWVVLIAWCVFLSRFRRGRPWLRSAPLAVGLVVATMLADASAILASSRMSASGGQSLALALLWVAALLSATTYLVLRTPDEGGGDDPRSPGQDPEPPWWPEFERAFRDHARRAARSPTRGPRSRAEIS